MVSSCHDLGFAGSRNRGDRKVGGDRDGSDTHDIPPCVRSYGLSLLSSAFVSLRAVAQEAKKPEDKSRMLSFFRVYRNVINKFCNPKVRN